MRALVRESEREKVRKSIITQSMLLFYVFGTRLCGTIQPQSMFKSKILASRHETLYNHPRAKARH